MLSIIKYNHHDDDDDQVKDVRVPAQLMRAMAAEAEAAREARAKVSLMLMMLPDHGGESNDEAW